MLCHHVACKVIVTKMLLMYTDTIPILNEFNFNEYEIVYAGGSINLTVEYSPDVLTFKWYRFHAPLPPGGRRSIINYSVNGKNYSSLILSNMIPDDWGLYIFTATGHCGTSSVNVTLKFDLGEVCCLCVFFNFTFCTFCRYPMF